MATREVLDFGDQRKTHAGTWGNSSSVTGSYTVVATTYPLNSGDVLRLAKIPANTRLLDATLFMSGTAAGMSATAKVGYVSSVAGSSDNDDAYFMTGIDVSANGRTRANTAKPPVVLDEDSYIVLTAGGANYAAGAIVTVEVRYQFLGPS